jgi:hypothetical protein
MNDKLFRILADNANNTKICHAKVSAYIAELIEGVKDKKPVKKTVKKKEK